MSTTLAEAPTTTTTPAVEADLASIFYPSVSPVVTPEASRTTPGTESGTPVTPLASTDSPDLASIESPVVPETKEKPADDKGHQAAARRLGTELSEAKKVLKTLEEENRILKAKADGTYETPAELSVREIEVRAEFKGREVSSRAVADSQFGAEVVQTQVYDDGSPYRALIAQKPWVHARVAQHPQPTLEAMRVLEEEKFLVKYGVDPTQWVSKIEADLKPTLLKVLQAQATIPVTGAKAPTLTEVRGSGGGDTRDRSLTDIFYGKS